MASKKTTLEVLVSEFQAHAIRDTEQFAAVTKTLEEVGKDVKSLLETRAFNRGAWWAMAGIPAMVSAIVGIIFAFLRH